MKSRSLVTGLLATLTLVGSSAILAAPTQGDGPKAWAGAHHGPGHRMHGFGVDGGFMHALHKLNLTDAQRASVKSILESDRTQVKSLHESMLNNHRTLASLTPDDPNYPTAVAAAKDLAGRAIQHSSDLRTQLYAVLTTEQKQQLPQVLAQQQRDMQTRFEQWRSQHQHTAPTGTT